MKHQIDFAPDFSLITVHLEQGESFVSESGAMVGMSESIKIKTSAKGGVFSSLKRKMFGGESIFQNTYTATADQQEIKFSPPTMGDIVPYQMKEGALLLQSKAYLASSPGIDLNTKWEGFRGFFGGNGLFLLRVTGSGTLFFNTYGAVHQKEIDGKYLVDTGHIVAFEPTLSYRVRSVGSLISLLFSGEGLVCEFSGQGKLWVQTRKPQRLAEFLHPFRELESKSDND